MLRWAVLGCACLIAGKAQAQDAGQAPVRLTQKQIEVVKSGVRMKLKDPESARFDRSFVSAKDEKGLVTVCGYVNSKNSYGGYVGDTPFGGMMMKNNKGKEVFVAYGIDSSPSGQYATKTICAKDGAVLD